MYDIDDGVFELNRVIDAHNANSKTKTKFPDFSKDDLDVGGQLILAALVLTFIMVAVSPMQWIGWLPYHSAWAVRAVLPLCALLTLVAPILIASGKTRTALCDVLSLAGDECTLYCRHGAAFACSIVATIILIAAALSSWIFMPIGSTDVAYDQPSYATMDKDADGLGETSMATYSD